MIQFVIGAALGIAGYKAFKEKIDEDKDFKEKVEKIEKVIKKNWEEVTKNGSEIGDDIFKSIIDTLTKEILDLEKDEKSKEEEKKKIEDIIEQEEIGYKSTVKLFVMYIKKQLY